MTLPGFRGVIESDNPVSCCCMSRRLFVPLLSLDGINCTLVLFMYLFYAIHMNHMKVITLIYTPEFWRVELMTVFPPDPALTVLFYSFPVMVAQ